MKHTIYIINSKNTSSVYVGSASRPLNIRLNEHKSHARCFNRGTKRTQCSSRHIIKYDDAKIEVLETIIDTISPDNIVDRESYWIELIRNEGVDVVNEKLPGSITRHGGVREYNRVKAAEKYEKLRVQEKVTCECGSTFLNRNSIQHSKSKRHKAWVEDEI